jgi:hypothetical protein
VEQFAQYRRVGNSVKLLDVFLANTMMVLDMETSEDRGDAGQHLVQGKLIASKRKLYDKKTEQGRQDSEYKKRTLGDLQATLLDVRIKLGLATAVAVSEEPPLAPVTAAAPTIDNTDKA